MVIIKFNQLENKVEEYVEKLNTDTIIFHNNNNKFSQY